MDDATLPSNKRFNGHLTVGVMHKFFKTPSRVSLLVYSNRKVEDTYVYTGGRWNMKQKIEWNRIARQCIESILYNNYV